MIVLSDSSYSTAFSTAFGIAKYTYIGVGGPRILYGDLSGKTLNIYNGSLFNARGVFTTGQTDVVIVVYDPATGVIETLASNICTELGTTGIYIWGSEQLSTQPNPNVYKEYDWQMSDGASTVEGHIFIIPDAYTMALLGEFSV